MVSRVGRRRATWRQRQGVDDPIRASATRWAQMKIQPENFRWYAAFHNEGTIPTSISSPTRDPREAYVTKKRLRICEAPWQGDLQAGLLQIYRADGPAHALAQQSREALREIIGSTARRENKTIEDLPHIWRSVSGTPGRAIRPESAAEIRWIRSDELERTRVARPRKMVRFRNEVLRTMPTSPRPRFRSRQEFKAIKNMVIAEAVNIGGHRFILRGGIRAII